MHLGKFGKLASLKGCRVFLTGHTGFKGSWLASFLTEIGAVVTGYSLENHHEYSFYNQNQIGRQVENEYIGDIRDPNLLHKALTDASPDVIIHMAAQPIVINSYMNPTETFDTNIMGLINLLEGARSVNSIRSIINITSDKCYENIDKIRGYKETDKLGGHDPYSASKACAELVTSSYYQSFFKKKRTAIATARAGNVIGGGDTSDFRLMPEIYQTLSRGETLEIRYPDATRPWQHVIETVFAYSYLMKHSLHDPEYYSGAWNFGPDSTDVMSVLDIAKYAKEIIGKGKIKIKKNNTFHEAKNLSLDCSKASKYLGISINWSVKDAVRYTLAWEQKIRAGSNAKELTMSQFSHYISSC